MSVTLLLLTALTAAATARELVVTSTADTGTGTLRWAIQAARSGDVITFDSTVFPPEDPAEVCVRTELPFIVQGNLTIDASNAGVILDGSDCSKGCVVGLEIQSNHNVVQGLQILHFPEAGIILSGAARHNVIGGDRNIGAGLTGQGNVVSGGLIGIGVWDDGVSFNTITGNLIGTDATGHEAMPNQETGILITRGAHSNTIGPSNIIAHNPCGVTIDGVCRSTVTGNSIHSHMGAGIVLREGGNNDVEPPSVLECHTGRGIVSGTTTPYGVVEVFSDGAEEGKIFEGTAIADASGLFSLARGNAFSGPNLTATVTDTTGSTSSFSEPLPLDNLDVLRFQSSLELPSTRLRVLSTEHLADNRIGASDDIVDFGYGGAQERVEFRRSTGVSSHHLFLDVGDWEDVIWTSATALGVHPETENVMGGYSTSSIDPVQERIVDDLFDLGIAVSCGLVFWDPDGRGQQHTPGYSRFSVEDEIQRFLDYVRFLVNHFRGRIEYYEVLNEPEGNIGSQQYVRPLDYIELIRRVIPVIRDGDPSAKIVVGNVDLAKDLAIGPGAWRHEDSLLLSLIASDVMPLVDGISWHPFYGVSPIWHAAYYDGYPELVREIAQTARSHGFAGELVAGETTWMTDAWCEVPWSPIYTQDVAAKYLARSTVMHLGMDIQVRVGVQPNFAYLPPRVLRNLCTIMAGHEAIDMPVDIDIETDDPVAHCAFRYPNGDRMLAIWTDGIAQDEDPGVPATIRLPGLAPGSIVGVDVLRGFEQELVFETDDGRTIIRNLLVKDYPILIRLSDIAFRPGYKETVGDGFHRIGDSGSVGSGTEPGGTDSDGDGVPDSEDLCPDWPGLPETSGC